MSLLFALISLILGLHFLKDNLFVSIGLTLLFVIFIFYRFRWKKSLIFIMLFLFGALFANIHRVYNSVDNTYSGLVVSAKKNYFILYSHGERFYVYDKNTEQGIGNFVVVSGIPENCDFTTYESQSDFNQYLLNKGVSRSIQPNGINTSFLNPFNVSKLKQDFLSTLKPNASSLADAMLFNTKDYSSEVVSIAEDVNLIFLLSTTGIYFSFFLRSLKKLIFLKYEERESHILSLLIVAPYVVFSFPKVGVLRIFLVNLFTIPAKTDNSSNNKPKNSYLTKLSVAHMILLLLNPYWAYESGFLIGLTLTVFLHFFRKSYRTGLSFKSKMVTPTLVFLFIQPFFSFRSGNLHLLTFFEQMLLIPVNELFIVISLICFIGIPITPVVNFLGNFIYEALKLFQKIDLKIPLSDYGSVYIALFYLLFVVALYLFEAKRHRHVKYAMCSILMLLLIGLMPIQPLIKSGVYFVNVGQGDSIIIQDHFHAVMIDTGGNISFDIAKKTLIPFLNKKQIYRLDALITTHDDFDHSGAAESLIENFNVKNYLHEKSDFPYQVANIQLENLNIYDGKSENDSSLVLKLNFYGTNYLLTGDAPKSVEKKIIKDNPDLNCDILKIGHHGSNTSSDVSFISALRPKEAIISCGRNNKYGHPNKEVISLLNKYDIKIRRTDQEGTISYLSYFAY